MQDDTEEPYLATFQALIRALTEFSHKMKMGEVTAVETSQAVSAMTALDSLLGPKLLSKAITLAQRSNGAIVEYRARDSKQRCFRVKGEEGNYRLTTEFCTCRSFVERSTSTATVPLCKHLIAVALREVDDSLEVILVADEDWPRYALEDQM